MSGLVDYDLTMCLVQILVLRSDYSLKGSHALFDLLWTVLHVGLQELVH